MGIGSDVCVCNLKSLMLRGQNYDEWVRNLNALICIYIGKPELLFNGITDNKITLLNLW